MLLLVIYGEPRKSWKSNFWNCGKYKWSWHLNEIACFSLHLIKNVIIKFIKVFPLLITFLSLSNINNTLKIGITRTWTFTLRYVITATSLWCWKKISYSDVTSISVRNRSISQSKSNKKSTSPQYRLPTGLLESENIIWKTGVTF